MTRRRALILAAVVLAGAFVLRTGTTRSSEYGSAPVSVLTAPTVLGGVDTAAAIRQFERRVEEDPRDFVSYTILGQLYARQGRDHAALARHAQAEQAFARALQLNPQHTPARALLAAAYASQHKFADALEAARAAYEQSPAQLDALATMADVYLDTGRYADAKEAVEQLVERAGNVPAVLARRARLAELEGKGGEAVRLLARGAAVMKEYAEPPHEIAWFQTRLADVYFHHGCLAEAEPHLNEALTLFPGYPIALAALADLRAAEGRLDEAVALYRRAIEGAPEPRTLFALGVLEERLGRIDDARRHYQQAEEQASRPDVYQPAYYRDLAAFYAERTDRAAEALAYAQRDLAIRQDVKAYDTLAWALFRNGRPQEAGAAIVEAVKLGTRDPDILYHAGMIHEALGDREASRQYLDQAYRISPRRNPAASPGARPACGVTG